MKTIGIYFIILGHFFSIGHKFIYVFNVPVFFIISGFLFKKECKESLFWRKTWYNLIVPLILISIIAFTYHCTISIIDGNFKTKHLIKFCLGLFIGLQYSVRTCWFVYSLLLIRIIFQYCNKIVLIILFFIFLICAYLYNISDYIIPPNSIVNVLTAYPFFFLGNLFSSHKDKINKVENRFILVFLFCINLLLIYLCGKYNDYVWMWKCGFGNNIFLFLLGGLSGTLTIYSISKLIDKNLYIVSTISKGTILILGFHYIIIEQLQKLYFAPFMEYIISLLILILFVPLIILCEKHFPLLLGKLRINR